MGEEKKRKLFATRGGVGKKQSPEAKVGVRALENTQYEGQRA
jgi:hypothetical protein